MSVISSWIRGILVSVPIVLAASQTLTFAETWPQRTVRLIVPHSAATGSNISARLFAERLTERWKHPVIVENRPGADGLTGVTAFVTMRDDHALLYSPAAPVSVFPVTHEMLPYDPTRDVVPISSATDTVVAIAASESANIGSLAEFVTAARSQPGKLSYVTGGGAFHIWFAGFIDRAGIDVMKASNRGPSLVFQDLAEGRVHVMMTMMTTVLPMVHAGKVRLLAVTNKKRFSLAPEVPTVAEAGYPDLTFEGLQGFFGPRDMPIQLRNRIATDIRAVAADPAIVERLAAVGQIPRGSTPAEFAAAIEEQRVQIAAVAKAVGAAKK